MVMELKTGIFSFQSGNSLARVPIYDSVLEEKHIVIKFGRISDHLIRSVEHFSICDEKMKRFDTKYSCNLKLN